MEDKNSIDLNVLYKLIVELIFGLNRFRIVS